MTNDNWLQTFLIALTLISVVAGFIASYVKDKRSEDKEIVDMKSKFESQISRNKEEKIELLGLINQSNNRINVLEERIRTINDTYKELKESLITELNEIKDLVRSLAEKLSQHMENHK